MGKELLKNRLDFVQGTLFFIGKLPFLQLGNGDPIDIYGTDTLDIFILPRGETRLVRWKKRGEEIRGHERLFNNCFCRLYPSKNRKIVLTKDDIATLLDHEIGDEITIVTNLSIHDSLTKHTKGNLVNISEDLKSLELRTAGTEEIKKFKFSEIDYVLKGHKKILF